VDVGVELNGGFVLPLVGLDDCRLFDGCLFGW
jgi:hypothetical protein